MTDEDIRPGQVTIQVLILGCRAAGQVDGLALQQAGVALGLLDQSAAARKLNRAREQGRLPLLFQHGVREVKYWFQENGYLRAKLP